jgi:predicted branched-subunit amino acid permease
MTTSANPTHPKWSLASFRQGAWAMLPLLPGIFAFGAGFGTLAAGKGFTLLETFVMTATVFAGMAQYIVLQSWPDQLTASAIVAAGLITAMVCSRFLLIGASMRPWLGSLPAGRAYPLLYVLTDSNWIVAMRYHAEGGRDPAYFLGSGFMIWCTWLLSAAPGYWLGASLGDPRTFGLDLVMPVFFAAMLVPLWRGLRGSIGWIVGAAVALGVEHFVGGFWYVLAGALAGSVVGGLTDD